MTAAVLVVGIVVQVVAWRLVAAGRLPFWPTTAGVWVALGAAAAVAGNLRCCLDADPVEALLVGVVVGLVLYAATRLVVAVASVRPRVAASVEVVYGRRGESSAAIAWTVSLLAVAGEEAFWRGLALPHLAGATAPAVGAILAWAAYVVVTVAWWSLPFAAAAIVGGAVWTALAWWSGGVAAPLASHLFWTAAMIAWPPGRGRAKVPG
jgi:membrane protease YdiL (CAAX protease family)